MSGLAGRALEILGGGSPIEEALRSLLGRSRDANLAAEIVDMPEVLLSGWAGADRLVRRLVPGCAAGAASGRKGGAAGARSGGAKFVAWGQATIDNPPRPLVTSGCVARSWRSAVEGIALRYPHRLLTDGRVFGRRRRHRGGAILIDSSGSMSITARDLAAILDAAPGAVVAAYAARHDHGVIRILACHGRRVAPEHLSMSGVGPHNVIDLPALEYLASQSTRPRIWVSDMVVTGIGDRTGPENLRQVKALLARTGIHRVATIGEAIKTLKRGRPARSCVAADRHTC
jgi:hypothetical protein